MRGCVFTNVAICCTNFGSSFPEWGLWGIDDPKFVQQMATFVKAHRRTRMIAYFNAKPGSIFDLASKPRSLAAYKRYIVPLGR